MGKRSSFERRERDFYPTPKEAVTPLLSFIQKGSRYVEPCAGDGSLIHHLDDGGLTCWWAFDIEPNHIMVGKKDAFTLSSDDVTIQVSDYIITNPPWSRDILHPMIDHFRKLLPTWLLFDADWMHTRQAIPYLPYCSDIVSVGRVKWIPDSKYTGKDNVCWYHFWDIEQETKFHGRQ